MRGFDWAASPLGPPESWPLSLKTVVGVMLNSKFPMFLAWGKELGFLYNDPYIEILGEKHPTALGMRFYDIWSEIWDDISPLIDRALDGESTFRENLPLTMKRHGYFEQTWFTFSYSPVRDETGSVRGIYCACMETTGQILAEQYRNKENERLRALFEQAPGFMAVLHGPQHVFDLTNKAYMQLVGHRQILGKTVRDAIPEMQGQGFLELLDRVYRTGEPYVGHALPITLQRTPDGPPEERFVDFVYQPIRDPAGAITGIFAEGSDVTERKMAEDELRAANRQKDQFLAMLAHELRNPLAPITTAAQLLKHHRLDEYGVRNASDIISRQAEHMADLLNDLLDVSRVTRGLVVLEKEELDLNVILTGAVEQVRSLIDARRHRLTLQLSGEPAHVHADKTRLVQIIANLLNNAAKYTPPAGDLTLGVRVHEQEVEVFVRDNGCGISPEILPYLFDLFTQAERAPDRSQGGLGIGLALVKNLVQLHGGSVEARSEGLNKGSQFTVRLPRIVAPIRSSSRPDSPGNEESKATVRVLIVDDNIDATQALGMLLESEGYRVSVEHDAASALDRIQHERPHILLLDIGLPDMDGYELARRLRAMPQTANALLVALTGYGQSQDREQSRQAGFDHHLVKPASLPQLIRILADVQIS